MRRFLLTASACVALVITASLHAAGDAEKGAGKVQVCAACHGADGNSTNPEWPKLAGQHASYTAKQLRDFKAGTERSNPQMTGMVANLTPEDMDDIAAFYATQTPTGGFVSEAQLELGQRIYRGGIKDRKVPACIACHGPKGDGNPPGVMPVVSGQWAKYTAIQLMAFRAGTRANDPDAMMRDAVRGLSDAEIQAVAEYMAGLH